MEPFSKGTLGMALSGKDTGGSQFFITQSVQPHLEGAYTAFGRLTSGFNVLDTIGQYDTVVGIEIKEATGHTIKNDGDTVEERQ